MGKNKRATPELKTNVYDLIKSNLIRMKTQYPNIREVQLLEYNIGIHLFDDASICIDNYNYPFDEGPLLRRNYNFHSFDEAINFDFEHDAKQSIGAIY